MPRKRRLVLPGIPLHIVQRGNDRRACFFHESDRLVFLHMLTESAYLTACDVHAFVLMTNHVHLLVTPNAERAAGRLMQLLGQRYVQYINRRHERVGTLWQGRFRSCLVEDENYFLMCQRYIELNPVRAGIVDSPEKYPWSSFRVNAFNEPSNLVKAHPVYEALGRDTAERLETYRDLFEIELSENVIAQMRESLNRNIVMSKSMFSEFVAVHSRQNLAI